MLLLLGPHVLREAVLGLRELLAGLERQLPLARELFAELGLLLPGVAQALVAVANGQLLRLSFRTLRPPEHAREDK